MAAGGGMSALDSLIAQTMAGAPQPLGSGFNMGGGGDMSSSGGGEMAPGGGPMAPAAGAPADPMSALAAASTGGGDPQKLVQMIGLLQSLYPQLRVADHKNGRAELTGPTQEQYLGAVWAKHHGAKEHHVRNTGRGQRLHLSW